MRTYFWRYVIDEDGILRQIFCGNAAEFGPADELAWEILNRRGTDPVEAVQIELHGQRLVAASTENINAKFVDLAPIIVQRTEAADVRHHTELVREFMVSALADEVMRSVLR